MANYATKYIKNLKPGEMILDGHLQPVEVVQVFSNFLYDKSLYQLAPDGPVFTEVHEFVSNLEQGHIGVVSKRDPGPLPQAAEKISFLKEMTTLLQFKNGSMTEANFQVGPYSKKMDPSTLVYFLITNGMDGSYIVNDFVSRDVLPVFEKWPLTYATLAGILMSCDIGDPHLSVETYETLVQQTQEHGKNDFCPAVECKHCKKAS